VIITENTPLIDQCESVSFYYEFNRLHRVTNSPVFPRHMVNENVLQTLLGKISFTVKYRWAKDKDKKQDKEEEN